MSSKKPRFEIGDRVRVVWPDRRMDVHHAGTVTQVVDPATEKDRVFRYRVTFPDGKVETFFGFELEGVA